MPTYDYECERCGERFEVVHGMMDVTKRACPKCGQPARRLISGGGGVLFKGSGFPVNDYPKSASGVRPGAACGRQTPCCGRDTFCGSPKCGS
jgi:putative FmdB family regulatory protein